MFLPTVQQLGKSLVQYSQITGILANEYTLSAVRCHGVYEVVVSAFSSPGTHGGW